MTATVPTASVVLIIVVLVLAFAIPILLAVWLHRKKGAHAVPFFVGCAVFLVFALVLESLMHQLVLNVSPAGPVIMGNIWLYALYGGLAAGVFEETGRFVAMKWLLKKHRANDANALMYGAGHGGFECMMILGLTMVNNLIYSLLINSGGVEALYSLLATTPGMDPALMETAKAQLDSAVVALTTTPAWIFPLGLVERIFAITLQLSFSVLVWFAVKTPGKGWLFPLAIVLHAVVDGSMALVQSAFGNVITEVFVGVVAAAVAFLAWRVWRANSRPAAAPVPEAAI